jgi:N-acyl-D-aspartate/D-glutamate deacylase
MPTDFLSNWIRDREVMPIEAGIRKLTGELADVFKLERGYVREGAHADIVVLDLDRVSTGPVRRVYDMPAGGERLIADSPTGIDHVLVNGVSIREEGKDVAGNLDRLPGQILRSRA